MKTLCLLVCLILSLMFFSSASAEIEIGLLGHTGWSDNTYLQNPDGWGVIVGKSLSDKMGVRFTFIKANNSFSYRNRMAFGFPPIGPEEPIEQIQSDVSAKFYDLTLYHAIFDHNNLRLNVGGGFGKADIDLDLRGETTGKTLSHQENPVSINLSFDVTVSQFFRSPFALQAGYQYRGMTAGALPTDSFEPFNTIKMSGVFVGLLAQW